ncbi:hypothetical protein OB2597_04715 [Pseudooceanicola batsensis HTCC2597]|uniref:Uncharacterized protein n=1 Tax=Pseudooceanicola batsensis (strain ATCC BAA-863 / DSM 15984 / KCTC 12145 / HTCC2597) TaxID=252305 RepID=A3TSC8_PSEBH|nr:hypothetical protein [Pseudooceanicola batsensis]EAQ04555.1 hypothetical protein OB2597_04715 [Pseudooceanicola batsensis HTCC2597]
MQSKMILKTGLRPDSRKLPFVVHRDISSLPHRPGLFVLLGPGQTRRDRPLYFGYADRSMRDQLPYDPGFAHAIRYGPLDFASAYVPGGEDPATLVHDLAVANDAPVNAAADALAEIEAAQSTIQAQALARKIAAQ